jgi:3-oxoacyl-[acyl-carrier-protein] synthase II
MSEHREGTILGEGCGILSLELRSSADERRIPYSAMITGYGSAFGLESNVYAPTTEAMCEAMVKAIATAGIHPSDIEVVIAHGDGTLKGDGNEIEALHLVYGGSIDSLYVFASKGALGNLFAGAPAVDTILGICMMQRGIIPPSVNSDPPAANIRFNFVRKPFHYRPKRIMVNAHSYEGQCFSLIIEATV